MMRMGVPWVWASWFDAGCGGRVRHVAGGGSPHEENGGRMRVVRGSGAGASRKARGGCRRRACPMLAVRPASVALDRSQA